MLNHSGSAYLIDFDGANGFPYPRDAIVNQDGVIVFTSKQYAPQETRAVVEALLGIGVE